MILTFEARLVVVALSAFALSGLIGAAMVAFWSMRRQATTAGDSTLMFVRVLPCLLGLGAMSQAIFAFAFLEQRGVEETPLVMVAMAGLATALFLGASWRAWRLHRRTQQTLAQWMASGTPTTLPGVNIPVYAVTSVFPIVAVVGVFRQRIIIARSVLDACDADQLRAILAHEQVHIDRHDNARRAIFTIAPDVLSWLPLSDRLLSSWHDRCEESADYGAGTLGDRGRVLLAEALIRVARLAPTTRAVHDLPASALYRGEDLRQRIHRLLAPPAALPAPHRRVWYAVALGLTASVLALEPVHEFVEIAVTWLP